MVVTSVVGESIPLLAEAPVETDIYVCSGDRDVSISSVAFKSRRRAREKERIEFQNDRKEGVLKSS